MNTRKAILLGFAVVFAGVLAVQFWRLRQPLPPEWDLVTTIRMQALEEIENFHKSGGKPGAPDSPVWKWVAKLWELRESRPGRMVGTQATAGAFELLAEGARWGDLLSKAKTLPVDDLAWPWVVYPLYTKAQSDKDLPAFIAFALNLRERREGNQPPDQLARAQLSYFVGQAYDSMQDAPRARAAFQRGIEEVPTSMVAESCRRGIYEVEHLGIGMPAPDFAGADPVGKPLALADLRGRTVLLDFWGKG